MHPSFLRARRILVLLAISVFAILVHGYHMGTDDAAIYAPGIERAADPSLFPFGFRIFHAPRGTLCVSAFSGGDNMAHPFAH